MPIQNILPLFLSISWFQSPFLTTAPFLFLFSFLLHSLQSWKKVFFFFLFALTLSLCFSFFLVFGLLSFYKYISYHLPLSLVSLSLFLPSFTTPLKTRSFFYLTLLPHTYFFFAIESNSSIFLSDIFDQHFHFASLSAHGGLQLFHPFVRSCFSTHFLFHPVKRKIKYCLDFPSGGGRLFDFDSSPSPSPTPRHRIVTKK